MARVLLQHRLRGLSGPLFQKFGNKLVHTVGNYLAGAGGLPDLPWPADTTFIGAFRGETDVQNVNVDGEICNLMPLGSGVATSVHNAPIFAPDFDGVYMEYAVDEPVWKGGRLGEVETPLYSFTFDSDLEGWVSWRGDSEWDAATQSLKLITSSTYPHSNIAVPLLITGKRYVMKAEVTLPARHSVDIAVAQGANNLTTYAEDAHTSVPELEVYHLELHFIARDNTYLQVAWGTGATAIGALFDNITVTEEVTYSTDTDGNPLKPTPFLQANEAATNLFFPSAAPASETLTIPATEHILWMEGTGSITSSYGTATEAVPLIFTGTAAGVVFTCTDVDIAQIELGDVPSIYIPTTTAAASIPATIYTYPQENIDPVEDTRITFRYENTGADGEIFDIGKNLILGMLNDELTLTDGVNTIELPLTKGTHDIEVIVSGHEMAIKVGTAYAVGAYTSVPAGLITASKNMWGLHTLPALDLERVLNGDFSDGDTGWTGVSVTNGQATTVATTGYQVIHTTASVEYEVNFQCDAKGVSPQLQVQNGNVTGSPVIAEVNPSGNGAMVPYSTTFTALGPDSIVILSNGSNTALWDNISIKAV